MLRQVISRLRNASRKLNNRTVARGAFRRRLFVESLEDRRLLASVLLIYDVIDANTASLRTALENAGHSVTYSSSSELSYNGSNPNPSGFGAVIHLDGTTYQSAMPAAGQSALVNYVQNGGGYIGAEWNAYEIGLGNSGLRELTLFDRTSGRQGNITYVTVSGQAGHPILAGVSTSFTFQSGANIGPLHTFSNQPATLLMTDDNGSGAVAVRNFGSGKVVGFNHAANYNGYNTLSNFEIQKLYVNAVGSLAGVPSTLTAALDSSGNLVIADTYATGKNNSLTSSVIVISGVPNLVITDLAEQFASTPAGGVLSNGNRTLTIPFSAIAGSEVIFNTNDGNDTLTENFAGGNFLKQIVFNGGGNTDSLIFQNGAFTNAIFNYTNSFDGSVSLDGNSTIYKGLDPIISTVTAANVTLNYSSSSETITVTSGGAGTTTVSSTLGETTTFLNPSVSLSINAGDSGSDIVTATTFGSGFNAALAINGGTGADSITVSPTLNLSAASANLTLSAETINLNGGSITTAGNQTFDGAVLLGADTTTTGANVTFNGPVNSGGIIGNSFQILSLTANNAAAIEVNVVTGDDRGGIAVSSSQVFLTGDNQTGRFSAADLSAGTGIGTQFDALTMDLATETVYSLGINPTTRLPYGGGTVSHLLAINGTTGALTGASIALTTPISVGNGTGIFAGYGRVVLLSGTGVASAIEVPSGVVTTLGSPGVPSHSLAESWAYWGVAERFGGQDFVTYAAPTFPVTQILRMQISNAAITTVATFSGLSDMASFAVSPSRNRWYFHYEYSGQFGSRDETLGFADATFSGGVNIPRALTVNTSGSTAFNGAVGGVSTLHTLSVNTTDLTAGAIATSIGLTVNNTGATSNITGTISGASATLAKSGNGTLKLSGANTYGGTTSVGAGTLLINGTNTGTGAVNVNNSAILGGTGSIAGAVNVNNTARLAPGNSPETLATGPVIFSSGTFFDVEINGVNPGDGVTGYDQLIVTGDSRTTILGGAEMVITLNLAPAVGNQQVYRIVDSTGTGSIVSGTFRVGGITRNDGDTFTVGSSVFRINYNPSGSAGDVILTEAGNTPPIVDLNGTNDAGVNFTAAFVEDAGPKNISDSDATITDAENAELANLTLVVSANPDGADETLVVAGVGVPLNANQTSTALVLSTTFQIAYDAATRTFTVTKNGGGTVPIGDLQAMLRGITYNNADNTPTTTDRTITITANDGIADSIVATATITVAAANDVPIITNSNLTLSATSIQENKFATISGSFVDPDTADFHTVTIDWGDGSTATSVNLGAGVLTFSNITHQYFDDNPTATGSDPYTISVSVSDTATLGGSAISASSAATTIVTVTNEIPVANAGADQTGNEGTAVTLNGAFTDVGTNDGHTQEWSVAASNGQVVLGLTIDNLTGDSNGSGASSFSFTPSDNGTYTVSYKVTDDDGGTHTDTSVITVNNLAPTLNLAGASTVNEGSLYTLNLSSSDPGNDIISEWRINWGDGSAEQPIAGNPPSVTHVYADGTRVYTILAKAIDEDGTWEVTASGGNAIVSQDPSFGNGGETTADFFGSTADYAQGLMVTQPDGKILVVGYTQGGNANIGLARYNVDGSPDIGFGINGSVVTEFGNYEYAYSAVLDNIGRILVGGSYGIARYLSDGSLDTSFGIGGKISIFTYVRDIVFDSQNRIVVGGSGRVQRFNSDGSVDLSFNSGNSLYLGFSADRMVLDAQDRPVLVGYVYTSATNNYDVRVGRVTTSGAMDTSSFGVTDGDGIPGVTTLDIGNRQDFGQLIAINSGKIVISGTTQPIYNNSTQTYFDPSGNGRIDSDVFVAQFNSDGTLDTSFSPGGLGGDGVAWLVLPYDTGSTQYHTWDSAYSLATTSTNDILLGGYFYGYGWIRLNSAGVLDSSLGSVPYTNRIISPLSAAYGITEDSAGRILLAGNLYLGSGQGSNFAVARYLANGTLDSTFGPGGSDGLNGVVNTDFQGSTADYIQKMTLTQPDGKIVVAGYKSGGVTELVLGRYNVDGTLDTTFGAGDGDGRDGFVIDGRYSNITALALDHQGRIVVSTYYQLLRYLPDGTPDNAFGASTTDNSVYVYNQLYVNTLQIDAAGKIVAGGYRYQYDASEQYSTYYFAIARFHSDSNSVLGIVAGDVDTSFGTSGVAVAGIDDDVTPAINPDPVYTPNFMYDMLIQPDGAIVGVGSSYAYNQSTRQYQRNSDFAIVRWTASGQLDATFGAGASYDSTGSLVLENLNGITLIDFGSWEYAQSVALDSQGRIVVAGSNRMARLTSGGSLDASFDTDGRVNSAYYAVSIYIDQSDRIVSGGSNTLARYNQNGSIDATFASGGALYVSNRNITQIRPDSASRILVSGSTGSSGPSGVDFWLSRYITGGLSVTVYNVAPQNLTVTGSTSAIEGGLVSLTASATDPAGAADPLTYSWNITRNGSPFLQTSGSNISFGVPDNGSYVATVTVDDGDGGTATRSHTIAVTNVNPAPSIRLVSATRVEGTQIDVTSSATDPAGANDTLTYSYAVYKNGSVTAFASGSGIDQTSFSFTPDDNGSYQIVLTVSDEDGGSAVASQTIAVTNVNPAPTIVSVSTIQVEGTQINVTSSATDPAGANDTLTYSYAVYKNGSATAVASGSGVNQTNFNFTPDDNGSYEIVLTVSDEDGGSAVASQTITVANVNPAPSIDSISSTRVEGTQIVVISSATDPAGANDTLTYSYAVYKNGSATAVASGSGVNQTNFNFTPDDNGSYEIVLTVSDEDGGSAVTSQTITVANVIPVITGLSVNSAVINENGSVTISGSFTDKGIQDTHTVLINWGNGETSSAAVVVQGSGSGTFSATHQYRDDNPTSTSFDPYTIRATVTDDDGGLSVSSTVGITVNNVIPAIAVLSNTSPEGGNAAEGQSITISGSFTDVGTLDTHKANINWGDGNVSTATLVQGAGSGTFAGSHAYTTGGIFTITVTLTDDDGGSVTSTTTAVITGIGVVGNTLYVIGTDKDDHVTINQAGSVYRVHADFLTTGNFRDVPIAGISRIVVQACGGNDQVTISGGISLPALIDGGKGDDKLNGGNGTNIIIGGDGNDDINGGNARDILIGGKGSDRLVGNGDEDILIAGWTDYDAFLPSTNYAPLWSLMAEWNRSTDQATRRSNITAGGGLNGTYRLSASAIPLAATVHDDNDQDKLTGSSGIDWFFANLSGGAFLDVITDKSVNELVEELT